jgi:hypothetical protein
MRSREPRSAALLISLYLDAADGAHWYARLRSFDDPAAGERTVRVAGEEELIHAVREWLTALVERP